MVRYVNIVPVNSVPHPSPSKKNRNPRISLRQKSSAGTTLLAASLNFCSRRDLTYRNVRETSLGRVVVVGPKSNGWIAGM
ncbi:MAG: hypothetical protein ACR2P1_00230 [Pseudomonadales bacterium]